MSRYSREIAMIVPEGVMISVKTDFQMLSDRQQWRIRLSADTDADLQRTCEAIAYLLAVAQTHDQDSASGGAVTPAGDLSAPDSSASATEERRPRV